MSKHKCPQPNCNAPALILFNLVCANPRCKNHDLKWQKEIESKPRYEHKTVGDQTFLGGYLYQKVYYDLYHSINPTDETEWVEARYGDDISCYLGEELFFASLCDDQVLLEAAKRWEDQNLLELD